MLCKIARYFAVPTVASGRQKMADRATLTRLAQKFYFEFLGLRDGGSRRRFDRRCYKQLIEDLEKANIRLSNSGKRFLELVVEERIRSGRAKVTQKDDELRKLQTIALEDLKLFWRELAVDEAMKIQWFRPDPETLDALLAAESPGQVREIWGEAYTFTTIPALRPATGTEGDPFIPDGEMETRISNWPPARREGRIPREMDDELIEEMGLTLADALFRYAEQFIGAKRDRRYPKSMSRPTSQLKRIWFVSVALAGAVCGVEVRTAIDAVGATRPEQRDSAEARA
jgi:hypothetical protein